MITGSFLAVILLLVSISQGATSLLHLQEPQQAFAQSGGIKLFLRVEPNTPQIGNSQAEGHENEIEIQGFSWAAADSSNGTNASPLTASGAASGKVELRDLTVYKSLDQGTPILFENLALGNHYQNVTLFGAVATEGQTRNLFSIQLNDVIASSMGIEGFNGTIPTEKITLNYEQIIFTYNTQAPDGSQQPVQTCFDRANVRAC